MTSLNYEDSLKRLLNATSKCVVRVYVVNAFNLSSRDIGSESDPYLIVSLGDKVYKERDSY
jgi:hypothetical protein